MINTLIFFSIQNWIKSHLCPAPEVETTETTDVTTTVAE